MFTVESTMGEIINSPEFRDCGYYMIPQIGEATEGFKAAKICQLPEVWPHQSMAEAFNYMRGLVRDGKKIFYKVPGNEARAIFHFPVEKKTKCAVICAGGGYNAVCSCVEGFPVAQRMNELGYHAFVVNYSTGAKMRAPEPMEDLAAAIAFINEHAKELNVEPEDYLLGGFSAGGHLAAAFGTKMLGYERYGVPKPGAVFLAYPVITMGEFADNETKNMLLKEPTPEGIELYSIEKHVDGDYPPAYIWQCERDEGVPIQNSRLMAEALKEAGVPYVYKTFDSNAHGWGIGTGTLAEGWFDEAVKFWEG